MNIPRAYQDSLQNLQANKVFAIFGPRQAGKTTLLVDFLAKLTVRYKLGSGDNIQLRHRLGEQNFDDILEYVKGYELIAIDEAQKIPNIGLALKIIVDQVPGVKVVVTGSSSFELAGQIGEPLTGRKKTCVLYPVSQLELSDLYNTAELKEKLTTFLIYGSYPEVVTADSLGQKREIITEIANSYLLKDILEFDRVKSSKNLLTLLQLLAFQIGSEVSLSELGQKIGVDYKTVARYLDLLEKAFVIYSLSGFSRNLRNEMTKKNKYYFYDVGVRNAIISNFNGLELRNDVGQLWENFIVIERLKKQSYHNIYANNYFWRTWNQQEIDFVEERDGVLYGYEIKWGKTVAKPPSVWLDTYSNAQFLTINNLNYLEFIT